MSVSAGSLLLLTPSGQQIPPTLDELLDQVVRTKLADSREWHLLVHYRRNLVSSGYRSQIDDPAFFLAPQGKTDPQAELEATLRAFFSTEEIKGSGQPAQCAYIARYQWCLYSGPHHDLEM